MRFVVALLAILGLLASPVTAAAAQAACKGHADQAMANMPMAGMSMAGMPGMTDAGAQKADPCCDPAKDAGGSKHKSSDCLQACAAMCSVVAALPGAEVAAPLPLIARAPRPSAVASPPPHEPGGLERPPRSIA